MNKIICILSSFISFLYEILKIEFGGQETSIVSIQITVT